MFFPFGISTSFLVFTQTILQAHRFFQYKKDGNFNVTRPINHNLMIAVNVFSTARNNFMYAIFLTGHFKGYTVKLNPLDGVYYCDLRPIMKTDAILKENIKTLDHLLVEDVWQFIT
jgi:hypothetical protein